MVTRSNMSSALDRLDKGNCTLVVVPSMTFDGHELAKIPGAIHFEERMLWLLQVLRNPGARLVYVTSMPLPPRLVRYSAELSGVADAMERIRLISCDDPASRALTRKILSAREIQQDIRAAIGAGGPAVMMCHVGTAQEEALAAALGAALFACPPSLSGLGTKSAGRDIFRAAGVPMPDGAEHLRDREDIVAALRRLNRRHPGIRRAVLKLNDSFAGGGNALFRFPDEAEDITEDRLTGLDFVDPDETPDSYLASFQDMGGVVETFVEGARKTSPSVQCILQPDGRVRITSTHEPILGGRSGQTYFGCSFPARSAYRTDIAAAARRIAEVLAGRGVVGHISIDFVCVATASGWEPYAIEVNLRMGGATAPLSYLELATGCRYDADSGAFPGTDGRPLYYRSADRLQNKAYRRLDADRLLDAAAARGLTLDPKTRTGAIFYMLGALPSVGKLGLVAVDRSRNAADRRYRDTVAAIDAIAAT